MKAIRIRNFHEVFKAIAKKTAERLQKKLNAVNEVQAKEAERLVLVDDDLEKLDANYQENVDIFESLLDSLHRNKVPPQSVVQRALERLPIDEYWKGQLQDIVGNYQDDGSVASGASGSTLRTLTELLAHMNLGAAGLNIMIPTLPADDNVSGLGMTSVYQPPERMAALAQRATMPPPLEEDASAAAMNDAMSQLHMSVHSGPDGAQSSVQVEEASTTSSMHMANEASKLCPDENDSCKFMCEISKKQLEP